MTHCFQDVADLRPYDVIEANLNRFVWHEVRGWDTPYPAEWAGPHATGLKQLGLKIIDPAAEED